MGKSLNKKKNGSINLYIGGMTLRFACVNTVFCMLTAYSTSKPICLPQQSHELKNQASLLYCSCNQLGAMSCMATIC
jgi:hypothetical protein